MEGLGGGGVKGSLQKIEEDLRVRMEDLQRIEGDCRVKMEIYKGLKKI